jgi:hypothetical protein
MRTLLILLGVLALAVISCDKSKSPPVTTAHSATEVPQMGEAHQKVQNVLAFKLESGAFAEGASIPKDHSCEGKNRAPPLHWSGAPAGAKSFALIVDDPDAPDPAAPKRVWVHWVMYNIAPTVTSLAEGISQAPAGALDGVNDWNKAGYGGPCPPIGRHRYFHRLYALDTVLPDLQNPTKSALLQAMQGHILAQAVLMGTYQKGGN